MISPSLSPSFGHFAKAAQNVSKARCSLVWEIIDVLRRPREAWRMHAKHILMGSDGYAIGGESPYYYKSLHRVQAFSCSDKSAHNEIRDFYAHMALTYERHFARCFCRYSGNIAMRYFRHNKILFKYKCQPSLAYLCFDSHDCLFNL